MKERLDSRFSGRLFAALLIISLLAPLEPVTAASQAQGHHLGSVPAMIFRARHIANGQAVHVPAPQEYLPADAAPSANIHVSYNGNWNPNAKTAFQAAADIWEKLIVSPVTIEISATWEDMNAIGPGVLGGASPSDLWTDFPGAPVANTWYPIALANKLAGSDLAPGKADIDASFNSSFPNWYFGTDGNPRWDQYDFESVVLHELGHGLGFFGSMEVSGSNGSWGYGSGSPVIYDRFVVNGSGQSLLDSSKFPNGSSALAAQLTSGDIFFNGSHATSANNAKPPKLYAPNPWKQGSSYSHLDESSFPTASGNGLMTPQLANGESTHSPGGIALGLFEDIGWTLAPKVQHKLYLPSMSKGAALAVKGIYGRVTLNGANASGVAIELCSYYGSTCTTPITTTAGVTTTAIISTVTDLSGDYSFNKALSLASGQKYQVRYRNTSFTTGRLLYWISPSVITYTAGSNLKMGTFDIADVALVAPSNGITATLPYTFTWKVRTASPTDIYQFHLYDPADNDPAWSAPNPGATASYILAGLPAVTGSPFVPGESYRWEVWVVGPDGGRGVSLDARTIKFAASPP
ncbi:MAG TPA: hypothetical protein VF498_11060 [Anaerolineales bacterium]